MPIRTTAPVRRVLVALLCTAALLAVAGCGGDDDDSAGAAKDAGGGATTTAATSLLGGSTAGGGTSSLPADSCAVATKAIEVIGWKVTKSENTTGPGGGPTSQCTWSGTSADGSAVNGWVAFITPDNIGSQPHTDETVDNVSEDAFKGEANEILVTGGDQPMRVWVSSSLEDTTNITNAVIDTLRAG